MFTVIGIVCLIAVFLIVMSIFKRSKVSSNDTLPLPTPVQSTVSSQVETEAPAPSVPTPAPVKKQNRPLNKRKR